MSSRGNNSAFISINYNVKLNLDQNSCSNGSFRILFIAVCLYELFGSLMWQLLLCFIVMEKWSKEFRRNRGNCLPKQKRNKIFLLYCFNLKTSLNFFWASAQKHNDNTSALVFQYMIFLSTVVDSVSVQNTHHEFPRHKDIT